MKEILLFAGCVLMAFSSLASCNNGYDEYGMVDPPRPVASDDQAFPGYFVKENGTGTGTSWDDAMSAEQLFTMLGNNSFKQGADIYMAGGIYKVGSSASDFIAITSGVNIHGGYDPASAGYTTSLSYPSTFQTIISGDLNDNGVADEGDCRLMEITTVVPVSFYGITFKCGYIGTSTHSDASGANISVRPGITVLNGGAVNMEYCNLEGCVSAITASGDAGGAAMYISNGIVKMDKCVVKDNQANNRGGAIRLVNSPGKDTKLYMNSCLIAHNGITGEFGGAIQVSGVCDIFMNNCTIVDNYANYGGAGINTSGRLVLLNSTLSNNLCADGSNGHELRCEGRNNWFLMNNIIIESEGKSTAANPSLCLNGSDKSIISGGYNLITFVGGTGSFTQQDTDKTGLTYNKVFGNAGLADNGGYPQTLALPNRRYAAVPLSLLQSYASQNLLTYNVGVDQRGVARDIQTACPGAYEYTGDNDGQTSVDGNIPDLTPGDGQWGN